MRALVIGASGLVGGALLPHLGRDAIGTFHTRSRSGLVQLDAADEAQLRKLLLATGPEIVFFPAAQANVDWCELHPQEAHFANVLPATTALAAAVESHAHFVFFSSDYVFDGLSGPYAEDAEPAPLSVYGQHKLELERRVLDAGGTVIRTTTVYGNEAPPAKNYAARLVARLRSGQHAQVPSDQISTPTSAEELAVDAVSVCAMPGIWHIAGPDLMSRTDFAHRIADAFGLDAELIEPVTTATLHQVAARPLKGGLRIDKLRTTATRERPTTPVSLRRLAHSVDW